ncbi:diguanylate cyclase domain-containing protein [Halomonas korlensis]|uniref:Diguanylate cyclase (GGDEF) domain-containing protein n=1 Tax=Halomonas korlensis TaxID=463301 RepID=A0A1I7KFD0_9GAMM|nr:GGDEF domain-containing protein [Halomonas korlensis]SFU96085.1 diguanylate cyclase (GGDEF) domain-containing protein [Halomonas korlensis]
MSRDFGFAHFRETRALVLLAKPGARVANQRLTYMAQYDILTGLPNRALFTDRLEVAIVQAKRSGKPLALLFMDLDRFKNVNDVFGHALGDGVLSEVALRLSFFGLSQGAGVSLCQALPCHGMCGLSA